MDSISTLLGSIYPHKVKMNVVISEAEKIILDASTEKETFGSVSLQSALARIDKLKTGARKNTGFMTHFTDIDRILTGFQSDTLNIAQFGGNSEANLHVLFFSLEMSTEQLTQRMFSAQTLEFGEGTALSSIASGNLNGYASRADSHLPALQHRTERNGFPHQVHTLQDPTPRPSTKRGSRDSASDEVSSR